jgi:hypothetical protein
MKHRELAKQAGLITNQDTEENNQEYLNDLERFVELVRADEREACAKLCEDLQLTKLVILDWADGTYDCAKAIRARGIE